MMIPLELKKKYIKDFADIDTALFTLAFNEPLPSKVLVVGSHDEPTANILAEMGHDVTGVDLREYDARLSPCNYRYVKGDFCDPDVVPERGQYDAFVSLSTIEHFGMGGYREGPLHAFYDVIAMRKAWELLRNGGKAYLTVPTGGHYLEIWPHWRVYDLNSLRDRLVQDFKTLTVYASTAADIVVDGRVKKMGESLTESDVNAFSGIPPHVSTLLVMEKVEMKRKAPEGA